MAYCRPIEKASGATTASIMHGSSWLSFSAAQETLFRVSASL
jgi:hypothetical protein